MRVGDGLLNGAGIGSWVALSCRSGEGFVRLIGFAGVDGKIPLVGPQCLG